jgi:hypothetical protein
VSVSAHVLSGAESKEVGFTTVAVGLGVAVVVGVLVGVAVLVGAVVAVGNGVALGAGVDVGADTGAQADNIRLTSKNTINVRFILRVLLWRSSRPTAGASAAARSAVGWMRMLGGHYCTFHGCKRHIYLIISCRTA